MANVKIKLTSDKTINNVNKYADLCVESKYITETLYDRQAIKQSISNILTWKPYERILNPSFGNQLWYKLFENMNNANRNELISTVKNMLSYEPRIKVENINVNTNIQSNEIYVSFTYTIPSLDDIAEEFSITITKQ